MTEEKRRRLDLCGNHFITDINVIWYEVGGERIQNGYHDTSTNRDPVVASDEYDILKE